MLDYFSGVSKQAILLPFVTVRWYVPKAELNPISTAGYKNYLEP